MSDSLLTRLVVTVVVIICFALWLSSERHQAPGCKNDCPTDISAAMSGFESLPKGHFM
jgi:hypothetical protein